MPLEARVRLVEPAGYTKISALGVEEQRTNVIIDLTSPPASWEALGDGFRVDARIVVFESDDALQAPSSALFRDGDEWAAFVVENGRARKRPVVSRRRTARTALVERGLDEGQSVILYPTDAIADGVRVKMRALESPSRADARRGPPRSMSLPHHVRRGRPIRARRRRASAGGRWSLQPEGIRVGHAAGWQPS